MWIYHRELCPNNKDEMANSVDPDQAAPRLLLWVWAGSTLFVQTCLSEILEYYGTLSWGIAKS